ncbi:hypothetical protein B0J15DRAFT_471822 [Fusarium solani]|uniref:Uncharacterized protein n=1 Tax=Fusarium solani TaxID=169388 RepID=A0A9P9G764_FUSSL|nr:uncharacterized protein B0J15DRAFT_471822 [Fusarium solani]KAH7234289.1 hypothetical protein B0J15DRAFT_471822 [Fusarium solani]
MSTQEILAKFHDIRIKFGEYDPQFKNMKSPQTVYDERASAIRSHVRHAWAQLASVLASSVPILQDEISRLGGQLKELKIDHKAGLEVEEKKYQEQLQNTRENTHAAGHGLTPHRGWIDLKPKREMNHCSTVAISAMANNDFNRVSPLAPVTTTQK